MRPIAVDRAFELRGGRVAQVRSTTSPPATCRCCSPGPSSTPAAAPCSTAPWTWLRQVHGATVVTVAAPGDQAGAEADAAVTDAPGTVLAVHTADCAPIALVSDEGPVAAVHAGLAGLGRRRGRPHGRAPGRPGRRAALRALVGPCIEPACYEFGKRDLDDVVAAVGEEARGVDVVGHAPPSTCRARSPPPWHRAGVDDVGDAPACTACDDRFHSHRARGDAGRQALLVWVEDA